MTNDFPSLEQAKAIIESFAPKRQLSDKPFTVSSRLVPVWIIPVAYVENEQLIEVRLG